jgi:hypothetical protein
MDRNFFLISVKYVNESAVALDWGENYEIFRVAFSQYVELSLQSDE